jgi:hypothetical protein
MIASGLVAGGRDGPEVPDDLAGRISRFGSSRGGQEKKADIAAEQTLDRPDGA